MEQVYVPRVLPAGETQNCMTNAAKQKQQGLWISLQSAVKLYDVKKLKGLNQSQVRQKWILKLAEFQPQ